MLHRIAQAILPLAQSLGGPGLALLAALDSSFLTFPEVADALIVVLTVTHPSRWFYYGAMTTLGSILGSVALFWVARKGGEAFLAKWVGPSVMARWFGLFRRFGLFSVVLTSVLPPPVPFKPFVILAGATGVGMVPFVATVAAGRGLRYIGEAWLAYAYGEQTSRFLSANLFRVSIGLMISAIAAGLLFVLYKRLRPGYNIGPTA